MTFGNPLCTKCNDIGKIRGHWYSLWRDTLCPVCRGNPYGYRQSLKRKENPPPISNSRRVIRNEESRIYNPHSTTNNTNDDLFTNMMIMNAVMDSHRPPAPPENVELPSHKHIEAPYQSVEDSHKHSSWSSDTSSSSDNSSHHSSSSWGSDSGSSFDSGSSSCDCGGGGGCD